MDEALANLPSAAGIYFDGKTGARQKVLTALGAKDLFILDAGGEPLSAWPYREIESLAGPEGVLRLGRRGNATPERLEVADPQFAAAIDARAVNVDRSGAIQRRQRGSVIGWSVAATISLVLVAYFGLPAIAGRLAPLVPPSLERQLGRAVEVQLRDVLDTKKSGAAFECGKAAPELAGRAALDKLVARLESAAALPVPLRSSVVRRDEANALALPGGTIYVFRGLIDKADNADEVAGVIAHEIGHIANRDGTKSVLQAGGLSFLFGMLLGDFVGGGAVVIAARTVLQSSYSRETEAKADAYGVVLIGKANGNARALATMLDKIGGATEPGMKILLDHPETKARIAAINKAAGTKPAVPFLSAGEWAALKKICSG